MLARRIHMAALAALALALPLAARAKPVGTYTVLVTGPGDAADPSIDAQAVVFSSDAGGDRDVLLYQIGAPPDVVTTVAGGPGDQDQPSVHLTTLAYRSPAGIVVTDWQTGTALRTPDAAAATDPARRCQPLDPVAHPVVSDVLAAWGCGTVGARSVVVSRYVGPLEEYDLAGTGDVFGASASGALVAYVDASDGSVWLHDSTPTSRTTTRVCGGRATGASVGDVGVPVVAVARASAKPDADIEVWDPTGGLGTPGRIAALVVPGEQRNPHLSGEWVAFEDLTSGVSQVVLWQWTTGLVFLPHPTASNQTLNDLSVISSAEVRVVYADDGDGTGGRRQIALYQLPYVNGVVPDDGAPNPLPWGPTPPCTGPVRPPPATCDAAAPVLARLELPRDAARPLLGELGFDAAPFPGDAELPVRVCVDLDHVTSGWLALGDAVLARPSAFGDGVRHLEYEGIVSGGAGRIAGVIAGKPGASLVARVIADPGREPQSCSVAAGPLPGGGAAGTGPGSGASPPGRRAPPGAGSGHGGCGTPGGAGALGGLALVAVLRLRRRPADARG